MKWSLGCLVLAALASPVTAGTLDTVKSRGQLICGVNGEELGFSVLTGGRWTGFDVDYCRAYAAAIFDDANKVKYVALTARDRFAALQSSAIDVLARNTTWSAASESRFGLLATGVTYYDGQGFLVNRNVKVRSASELVDRPICVEEGTTSELNLADYFEAQGAKPKVLTFPHRDEALKAYAAGRCDAFTADATSLYGARLTIGHVNDHVILSDIISREPLTPFVRKGDDEWFNIIRWVHFAMLIAEGLNITQVNVGRQMDSNNPRIRRLLGIDPNSAEEMGLTKDWALRVIKWVGNYAEVFDPNLGRGSPLQIPRGLNELWTNGGLQYAPQYR